MTLCKRPVPQDDHLQETGLSESSLARGRPCWMIICKKSVPHFDRQGTSSQYQYCYLDLVIWYWDECGNPSGRGCKKSIGQIKSLLGLQFHRKRQISPPSYMNIASLLQFFTQVSNNSLK
jgi:hypothetical protein